MKMLLLLLLLLLTCDAYLPSDDHVVCERLGMRTWEVTLLRHAVRITRWPDGFPRDRWTKL